MIGCDYGTTVNNFAFVNYLAHFYLAYPDSNLMFGNYIGDGVRGATFNSFSEEVQRGIRFHRFIDTYTDSHDVVNEAKKLFHPTQAKFSGVVLDVLFDYFLANSWGRYSDVQLSEFAQECYATIGNHAESMPERSARFYQYMVSKNILERYKSERGITEVFRGMDSRTKYTSNMRTSMHDLKAFHQDVDQAFHQFFPDLQFATKEWMKEN